MSTSPGPQQSPAEPILARKPRKSIKAPAVKTAVLIQRAQGAQKSQIARDLDISRPTVDRIIEEANLDELLASGQVQSAALIPEAIRVAKQKLSQNSENMAIKVLENTIWPLSERKNRAPVDQALYLSIQTLIQPQSSAEVVQTNPPTLQTQPVKP